jgi:hypothetical protein
MGLGRSALSLCDDSRPGLDLKRADRYVKCVWWGAQKPIITGMEETCKRESKR